MRRNDEFESSKIFRILKAPRRAIGDLWERLNDDSIRLHRTPLQTAIWILTFPFRLLFNFGVFMVFAWTTSRSNRAFLRGLPAIVVLGGFGAVIWLSFFIVNDSAQIARTEGYTQMHLEVSSDHPEYADIFSERLVYLLPKDLDALYRLGQSKSRLGDDFLAMQIYEFLAPVEDANGNGRLDPGEDLDHNGAISPGYAVAHVRLAQLFQFDRVTDRELSKEERLELAAKHYELALAKAPDEDASDDSENADGSEVEGEDLDFNDLVALKGIADIRKEQGRDAEAAASLERMYEGQVVKTLIQVDSLPDLLEMRKELGQLDEARELARQTVDQLEKFARRDSESINIWLSLFRCEMFLAQNPAMTLSDGDPGSALERRRRIDFRNVESQFQLASSMIKSDRGKIQVRQAFAAVVVQIADEIVDLGERDPFERKLALLCRSIKVAPTNREVYKRLLFYADLDTDEQIEWLRDFYYNKSLLADADSKSKSKSKGIQKSDDGNTSAIVHSLIGIIELTRGDFANAQSNWKIANKRRPGLAPLVIDKLISVSMQEDQPPLRKVGEMLAVANELFPKNLGLQITHVAYLRRHGRADEAVGLLEDVLANIPENVNVNTLMGLKQQLIRLYEETGDEVKAAEQRDLLEFQIQQLSISPTDKDRLKASLDAIE